MHEYQFKIKKGDLEFEFSTTDKFTFEEKLSDWINGVVRGDYVAPPVCADVEAAPIESQDESVERSGFIEVRNLASVKDLQAPRFEQPMPDVAEGNFEAVLEDSITNPKTEVVEKVDPIADFKTFADSFNPQEQLDYLVITALYILNMENLERFSLKQLNAKLVPLNGKPVDHSVIQDALEQGLIRVMPDLTGTSEVTEYTLTEEGEGYFVQ